MDDCRIEHREALTYVALPMRVGMSELGQRIQEGYRRLDLFLGERELEDRGPTIIRYRSTRPAGLMDIEVGWLMGGMSPVPPPFVLTACPAGTYAVAWHDGPYARLASIAEEAIAWAGSQGFRCDVASGPESDAWASWYEVYLADPAFGPEGPAGSVEVCLKLADA